MKHEIFTGIFDPHCDNDGIVKIFLLNDNIKMSFSEIACVRCGLGVTATAGLKGGAH